MSSVPDALILDHLRRHLACVDPHPARSLPETMARLIAKVGLDMIEVVDWIHATTDGYVSELEFELWASVGDSNPNFPAAARMAQQSLFAPTARI